ncbi:MAG: hypothetical protein ABR498_05485, partial [Candidatus Dormibacteria bacterium]
HFNFAHSGRLIMSDREASYARWLKAAAIYNAVWGLTNMLFPKAVFRLLRMPQPEPLAFWRVTAMMVAVYAPAYWWAAGDPIGRAPVTGVGFAGKLLGPLGFVLEARARRLPARFGLTIITNDLVWLPAFARLLGDAISRGKLEPQVHSRAL